MKRILFVISAFILFCMTAVLYANPQADKFVEMLKDRHEILLKTKQFFPGMVYRTEEGLIKLCDDSTYIVKSMRVPTGYTGRWRIAGDTIIFYENNDSVFYDEHGILKDDSTLCDILILGLDTLVGPGESFGKIFWRTYEIGHSIKWRNEIRALISEDSIGLYLKPFRYGQQNDNDEYSLLALIRVAREPAQYFEYFEPYYVYNYTLDEKFPMIHFPHLLREYGPDVCSLRHEYKRILQIYPNDYKPNKYGVYW